MYECPRARARARPVFFKASENPSLAARRGTPGHASNYYSWSWCRVWILHTYIHVWTSPSFFSRESRKRERTIIFRLFSTRLSPLILFIFPLLLSLTRARDRRLRARVLHPFKVEIVERVRVMRLKRNDAAREWRSWVEQCGETLQCRRLRLIQTIKRALFLSVARHTIRLRNNNAREILGCRMPRRRRKERRASLRVCDSLFTILVPFRFEKAEDSQRGRIIGYI